jgi:hypothetical protein
MAVTCRFHVPPSPPFNTLNSYILHNQLTGVAIHLAPNQLYRIDPRSKHAAAVNYLPIILRGPWFKSSTQSIPPK